MRLRIASPCPVDFNAMRDDGATRFCANCNKSVHDLSRATPAEVRSFAAEHAGRRMCVRVGIAALAMALTSCSAADQVVQPVVQIGPLPPAPPATANPDAGPPDDEMMMMGELVEPK